MTNARILENLSPPSATIGEALAQIERCESKIVLVVDAEQKLLGTITDGDVRRGILRGLSLSDPAEKVMFRSPRFFRVGYQRDDVLAFMRRNCLLQVPILDNQNRVVDLVSALVTWRQDIRPNWVVLMAGGRGQRLLPLTTNTPKPMLPVGGRPLLETIVHHFIKQSFHRFYISVNYLAEQVKDHFGDGSQLGVEIRYLEESHPMGTAGALSLLPEVPEHPIIVTNGDILTEAKFHEIVDTHNRWGGAASMVVREHEFTVPYGVVMMEGNKVTGLIEKPAHKLSVNAGIYILSPEVLPRDPSQHLDMTDLLSRLVEEGKNVNAITLNDFWLDIGRVEDFKRANDYISAQTDTTISDKSES